MWKRHQDNPISSSLEFWHDTSLWCITFPCTAVYRFGAAPRLSLLIFTWISCFPPEAKPRYLFVLITGYFLAKKFSKFSSLIYLWIKTFSYVIVFFLLFCTLGLHPFNWSSLISCFFPIRNDFYWFVSAYFLLILLSPFITIGIKALGQRKLFTFLLIFGFFWSVIPTLTTKPEYYGSTLFWFVYLFSWGCVSQRLSRKENLLPSLCLSVCGASWGIIAIIIALADWNNRVGTFIGYIDWFTFANLYSVFSLICALSLFGVLQTDADRLQALDQQICCSDVRCLPHSWESDCLPMALEQSIPRAGIFGFLLVHPLCTCSNHNRIFYLRDFGSYLGKGPSIPDIKIPFSPTPAVR